MRSLLGGVIQPVPPPGHPNGSGSDVGLMAIRPGVEASSTVFASAGFGGAAGGFTAGPLLECMYQNNSSSSNNDSSRSPSDSRSRSRSPTSTALAATPINTRFIIVPPFL